MKQLLWLENIGGRVLKWWRHHDADGKEVLTTETVQPVDELMDRNRQLYNAAPARSGDLKYVAEIPSTLLEEECRLICVKSGERYSTVFRELMQCRSARAKGIWRKLLNDRDLRYFRTAPGRVAVR